MKRRVWTEILAASAAVLFALSAGAVVKAQAAFTPERSPTPGGRTYANARVVAVDAQARTITVRGGGVGKDETFLVEAQALQGVGALKAGDQVVLTLRAGGAGRDVVTQIERSVAGAGARGRTSAAPPRREPAGATSTPTRPAPRTGPSPAARPAPSPAPKGLPTDTVGPLRDPRQDPNFDPRQDPLRDPRVVPGLSKPVPSPTPTPTPSPNARG
jgi:hypothetical protein